MSHQKLWKWHGVATYLKFRLQAQQAGNSHITPEASVQQCLHHKWVPSTLQLAKGRGTKHRKAQAPTEAGCIWFGFREQCCQGSASYLRMAGCLSEQGKQQGQKEIAKANAKDGTEKAWDAKVVELWLIANLIPAFGGASIINTKCHIGLNRTQTMQGQSTE